MKTIHSYRFPHSPLTNYICNNMPPQTSHSQPKKTKRVRFAEFAKLTLFERPSREVLLTRWYNEREKHYFKIAIRRDVSALRETSVEKEVEAIAHAIIHTKADVTPENYSLQLHERGIDAHGIERSVSPLVMKLIVQGRKSAIYHVIHEQRRQKSLDVKDEDRLAEVSRKYSRFAREWSSRIATAKAA